MNPSDQIDKQIADLPDWRGKKYSEIRGLIHEAFPEIQEDFKWGTGVFTHKGNVCAVGTFKDHIKINFFQGAAIADPKKLFNSGLEAKKTRAIDLFENDTIDKNALKKLIAAAVDFNNKVS